MGKRATKDDEAQRVVVCYQETAEPMPPVQVVRVRHIDERDEDTPKRARATTINKKNMERVKQATVTLTKMGGRGVLVPGGLILTAAHCITHKSDGSMVLGEYFIENIKTHQGKMKASPLAVEPVSDIAALGSLDGQEFYSECERFETFCENVTPIRLCLSDFPILEPFRVHIRTHLGKWVTGDAILAREGASTLSIRFNKVVPGGTSGSPIVNDAGELVALCSNSGEAGGKGSYGPQPRPHLSLPVWLSELIKTAQVDGK